MTFAEVPGASLREPTRLRPRPSRLYRRDLGDDEHGAQERARAEGRATARQRSARTLEDHDFRRRAVPFWPHLRKAIEAVGATLLYLPPYSPDFNPIEKAFSKLKALLRKAAERTVDALWDRIGALLKEYSSAECANLFAAAGYEPL